MMSQAYKVNYYEEDEDDVPNEFSGDEIFENGGRDSEHFAPRASVSSMGSRRGRDTEAKPTKNLARKDQEYSSEKEMRFSPGNESSVVEEIVE
jgi:hypothetical protein